MQRAYLIEDWPGPWAKWARNYLERNLWRIQHVIGNDIEDAMSEAALTYVETRIRYGATVNSPQHFMYMYKRALTCWVTDLSYKDTRIKIILAAASPNEPSTVHDGDLSILLEKGSSELKEVLNIFFKAPQEIMDVLRKEVPINSLDKFWKAAVVKAGIQKDKSDILMKELTTLLS